MWGRLRAYWPAVAVTLLYMIAVSALVAVGVRHTDGHLIYPLDDAYIHMSVARSMAEHLVWGVTPHAFSSSTTSPLWTAILVIAFALGGSRNWMPLALNAAAGIALIFCLFALLRRHFGPRGTFLYLLAAAAATSLPALTLLGMEHTLHALLTVLFVSLSATVLASSERRPKAGVLLLLTAALLPMARYEGVFAIGVVCLFLCLQRRFRLAAALGLAGALPILLQGGIAISRGWYLVPNSVLLKGHLPNLSSVREALESLVLRCLRALTTEKHLLAVVLLVLLGLYGTREGEAKQGRHVWLAGVFLCVLLLQLQFAATGWCSRYDAYLVTLGLLAAAPAVPSLLRRVVAGVRPVAASSVPFLVAAFCLVSAIVYPLVSRAVRAPAEAAMAMHDRYLEHIQPALFVQRYYPESAVVVNDIGAMSYIGQCRLLDIYGLGSMEPLRLRQRRAGCGPDDVREWAAREGAEIAILQVEWVEMQSRVPREWVLVAEWEIPRNVVFGDTRVGFFGVDSLSAKKLADNISEFAAVLPRDIALTMAGGFESLVVSAPPP